MDNFSRESQELLFKNIDLVEKAEEEIVYEQELDTACKTYLFLLKQKLFYPEIQEALEKKPPVEEIRDFLWFRKRRTVQPEEYPPTDDRWLINQTWYQFGAGAYQFEDMRTEDLKRWKQNIDMDHGNDEDLQILRNIKPNEVPVQLNKLLEEKNVESVLELLEHSVELSPSECALIESSIEAIATFRKRKIRELVTHRLANTVEATMDTEQFIYLSHAVADEIATSPRNVEIKVKTGLLGGNFSCAVLPTLVPRALETLFQKIASERTDMSIDEAEPEALKYYLFFEAIHPFKDGNGRTGRALFTFLIRKFTKDNPAKNIRFPHIPIARYDTETTTDTETNRRNSPGSIAAPLNGIVHKVMWNTSLRETLDNTHQKASMANSDLLFERVWEIIDTENEDLVASFIAQRKELSSMDSVDNEDFADINQVIRRELREQRTRSSQE